MNAVKGIVGLLNAVLSLASISLSLAGYMCLCTGADVRWIMYFTPIWIAQPFVFVIFMRLYSASRK